MRKFIKPKKILKRFDTKTILILALTVAFAVSSENVDNTENFDTKVKTATDQF